MSENTITINRFTFQLILAKATEFYLAWAVGLHTKSFENLRENEYDLWEFDEIAELATERLSSTITLPNGHEDEDTLQDIAKDLCVDPRQAHEWIFGAGGGYDWMVFKDKHKHHQGSAWLADFANKNHIKNLSLSSNVDWCWSPEEERYVFINLTSSDISLVGLSAIGATEQKNWVDVE